MENDLNTSKLRKGDKWGNVWSALGWLWSCVAFESGGGVSYMGGLCLPASSDHLNILLHLLVGSELNFKPFSSCPKQETVQRHQFLCISQGTHQNVVEIFLKKWHLRMRPGHCQAFTVHLSGIQQWCLMSTNMDTGSTDKVKTKRCHMFSERIGQVFRTVPKFWQ